VDGFNHHQSKGTGSQEHPCQRDSIHYQTRHAAQQDVLQYISMFYNSHRPHSYLGYKSQNQYEAEMEKLKNVTQLEYPVLLDQIMAKCPGVLGQNKEQ